MVDSSPLLSVVVTSRNDLYDDDLLNRMALFFNNFQLQAHMTGLSAEIVLVEWNPPPNRPSLMEALSKFDLYGPCPIRVIVVPPSLHGKIPNAQFIPLFQMIAKNVGIRRAVGKFILATNMDVLISTEMMAYFARSELKDRMYRVDRYDVDAHVPFEASPKERMEFCEQNILRVYTRDGVIEANIRPRLGWLKNWGRLHTNACGDFTLLSRERWLELGAYPEFPMRAFKIDGLLCYAAHYAGAREKVLKSPLRVYHLDHPARGDGMIVAVQDLDSSSTSASCTLTREQYAGYVNTMRTTKRPVIFNKKDDWGLPDESLPETVIPPRDMACTGA